MRRRSFVPWLLLMVFALAVMSGGCVSYSDNWSDDPWHPDPDPRYLRGQFIDGPVGGLTYTSSAGSHTTNRDGYFEYRAGDNIVFKVGNITLPPVRGASVILPMSYYPGTDKDDVDDPDVVKFVRFIMSAAGVKDGDTLDENLRLTIPAASQVFGGKTGTWDTGGNLFNELLEANLITVSTETAIEHITKSIGNLPPEPGPGPGPGPDPGEFDINRIIGTWVPTSGSGSGTAYGVPIQVKFNSANPGYVRIHSISNATSTYVDVESELDWNLLVSIPAYGIIDEEQSMYYARATDRWTRHGTNVFRHTYRDYDGSQSWEVTFNPNGTTATVRETGQASYGSYTANYVLTRTN